MKTNAFTKKRSNVFAIVKCAVCQKSCSTTDVFKDEAGNHWCPDDEKRGRLLDLAIKQDYPAISFTGIALQQSAVPEIPDYIAKYAIGFEGHADNKDRWHYAIVYGNDDMIDGALKHMEG
jgi:hypothetical protein